MNTGNTHKQKSPAAPTTGTLPKPSTAAKNALNSPHGQAAAAALEADLTAREKALEPLLRSLGVQVYGGYLHRGYVEESPELIEARFNLERAVGQYPSKYRCESDLVAALANVEKWAAEVKRLTRRDAR